MHVFFSLSCSNMISISLKITAGGTVAPVMFGSRPSYGMTGRRLFDKIVRDWREASDNDRDSERKRSVKNSITLAGPFFLTLFSVYTSKFARVKQHLPDSSIICHK